MIVQRLVEPISGKSWYEPFLETVSADAFILHLKHEWFDLWGRAKEISAPTFYPEFFTVDVVFRSSKGKANVRFLIPREDAKQ